MLHVAVQSRNSLMLSYLLHALPTEYVDIVDTNGRSALMLAVYQGDLTFVKILLKFNASVNVQDSEGFSALHWAAVQGKATLFEILLQNGANDSVRNDKSLTAENLSMELGSHKEFKLAKNRSQIFNHKFLVRTVSSIVYLTMVGSIHPLHLSVVNDVCDFVLDCKIPFFHIHTFSIFVCIFDTNYQQRGNFHNNARFIFSKFIFDVTIL